MSIPSSTSSPKWNFQGTSPTSPEPWISSIYSNKARNFSHSLWKILTVLLYGLASLRRKSVKFNPCAELIEVSLFCFTDFCFTECCNKKGGSEVLCGRIENFFRYE